MGKNPHYIKNSTDFIQKVRNLEVPPGRRMISYDVSALFTSIPVDKAIDVIQANLRRDSNLKQRCELSIEQLNYIYIIKFTF